MEIPRIKIVNPTGDIHACEVFVNDKPIGRMLSGVHYRWDQDQAEPNFVAELQFHPAEVHIEHVNANMVFAIRQREGGFRRFLVIEEIGPRKPNMTRAYWEGWHAHMTGFTQESNPFHCSRRVQRREWDKGWQAAQVFTEESKEAED